MEKAPFSLPFAVPRTRKRDVTSGQDMFSVALCPRDADYLAGV